MSLLTDAETNYYSAQTSINQGLEDIASNQYYLKRWSDEYDSQMSSALSATEQAWREAASALGNTEAIAGASGRAGSVNLISRGQDQAIRGLTGGSLNYSLGGQLGAYVGGTAQDLLAERTTAISSIGIQQQAINTYRETMASLRESMISLQNTTKGIKDTLAKNDRHV